MKWDRLRLFYIVSQSKSLTEASSLLNISQSALSRQMQALEQEIGSRLFIRKSRGIELTSRSRKIDHNDLYEFDHILVMDKDNFHAVKSLNQDQLNSVNSKIKLILSYSKDSQLDEVPDPYYGGQNGFDKVLDLLDNAIDGLIDSLID